MNESETQFQYVDVVGITTHKHYVYFISHGATDSFFYFFQQIQRTLFKYSHILFRIFLPNISSSSVLRSNHSRPHSTAASRIPAAMTTLPPANPVALKKARTQVDSPTTRRSDATCSGWHKLEFLGWTYVWQPARQVTCHLRCPGRPIDRYTDHWFRDRALSISGQIREMPHKRHQGHQRHHRHQRPRRRPYTCRARKNARGWYVEIHSGKSRVHS